MQGYRLLNTHRTKARKTRPSAGPILIGKDPTHFITTLYTDCPFFWSTQNMQPTSYLPLHHPPEEKGSWSPVTPTGADEERDLLWFFFSPFPIRFLGTQLHIRCPSYSFCPFALSRKQEVPFSWEKPYEHPDYLPRLCLLFLEQESWEQFSARSTVRTVRSLQELGASCTCFCPQRPGPAAGILHPKGMKTRARRSRSGTGCSAFQPDMDWTQTQRFL